MNIVFQRDRFVQSTFIPLRRIANGEHRQVITLFCTAHKSAHSLVNGFQQFLRLHVSASSKYLLYLLDAELFVFTVLRLRQSVGIKEDGAIGLKIRLHHVIFHLIEQADGQMRFGLQTGPLTICQNQRDIVTGITIPQMTCRQVEHTDEQGDKHIGVVTLTSRFVDVLHDEARIVLMARESTEVRTGSRHQHGRRRTLTADITDTEE